jgi:hypothetical protein
LFFQGPQISAQNHFQGSGAVVLLGVQINVKNRVFRPFRFQVRQGKSRLPGKPGPAVGLLEQLLHR